MKSMSLRCTIAGVLVAAAVAGPAWAELAFTVTIMQGDDGKFGPIIQPVDVTMPVMKGAARKQYLEAAKAVTAKDYATAATLAEAMTRTDPEGLHILKLLAAAQVGGRDWQGAKRTYLGALKLAPDDPALHAGLGVSLGMLQDRETEAQLNWLDAKVRACGPGCPDERRLKALVMDVERAWYAGGKGP